MQVTREEKVKQFLQELSSFAGKAEEVLKKIEENPEDNKALFSVFSERMFAIRGSAQQLNMERVAKIAELGEEIALKGTTAATRPQVRKCVGSLWDALTTVKHLLVHEGENTGEEEDILMNRLEATLRAFGGGREKVDANELETLLKLPH